MQSLTVGARLWRRALVLPLEAQQGEARQGGLSRVKTGQMPGRRKAGRGKAECVTGERDRSVHDLECRKRQAAACSLTLLDSSNWELSLGTAEEHNSALCVVGLAELLD